MAIDKDRIRESVDLAELAGRSIELKRSGRTYSGLCPFHDDHNPSLTIDPDKQTFRCWSCGAAGDVFDWVMRIQNVGFAEAARILGGNSEFRPVAQQPREVSKKERALYAWESAEWQAKAKKIIEQGRDALAKSQEAQSYLEGRGLSAETWRAFDLGYSDYIKKDSRERVRSIVIPWQGKDGLIVGIKYRNIDVQDKNRRFSFLPGSQQIGFGSHLGKTSERVIAIEGEFNAMSVWQAVQGKGIDVLSFGGQWVWRTYLADVMRLWKQVAFWADEQKVLDAIAKEPSAASILPLRSPNGLDANDILSVYGEDVLAGIINKRFDN